MSFSATIVVACDHEESTASSVLFTNKPEPSNGVLTTGHHNILKQLTKAGFDGKFVLIVNLKIIRHRTHVANLTVRLSQNKPCGIGIPCSGSLNLL